MVEGDGLRALIEGREPKVGTALFPEKRRRRKVQAIDITLSPPKSVSLLWAFGTKETSAVASIAHVEAVTAALEFLEQRAAVTRQQSGGVRWQVSTSGLAVATFVHRTSREDDPQLHSHCVIANLVHRPDGSWVAIDAAGLYRWAKAAGSIYQEELRRRLTERLGVAWGPDRNGTREMLGFTEAQLTMFSKRSRQIEEHLAAAGIEPVDAKDRMRADEAASLATRRRKDRSLTPERLRDRWAGEAEQVGLSTGRALDRLVREAGRECPRPLASVALGEFVGRLVDPDIGLCAYDSRFTEAQLIERIAAFGAGRLTSEQIQDFAEAFLGSSYVVRLMDRDPTGRTPPSWSMVAHREVEDRVLDNLTAQRSRPAVPIEPTLLELVMAVHGWLGADQAEAVRVLVGCGGALRALVAPAGSGKTTALVAAADAARRSGRMVVAVATTNQAVAELRLAGLDARTVARFALDGCPLGSDSVLIVDELSQLPTVEADVVLSAVTGCEGAQLWLVGDPLQTQPVRAGGLAPLIGQLAEEGRIPSATLSVNRRQADPVERLALAHFRGGEVAASQQLRDDAGLEHECGDDDRARQAMADAVVEAVEDHGSEQVVALAVTHADCEEISDRIRGLLAERGVVGGPVLEGPGWTGSRCYQAGDRIVLHATLRLADGGLLANGTAATVVWAGPAGLTVRPDRADTTVMVPAEWVAGRQPDGRPHVSHGWCRTIDGVQGGTWRVVHLLGTDALDRYRAYVGQSRATQGTHTWNTRPEDPGDHGGQLVRGADTPAGEVLAAMSRDRAKTFAAFDDPYRLADRLTRHAAAHRAVLATRPVDVSVQLHGATAQLAAAEHSLSQTQAWVTHWQDELDAAGGIGRLRPGARRRHDQAGASLRSTRQSLDVALRRVEDCRQRLSELGTRHQAGRAFDRAESWRHRRIADLEHELDQHWADTVLAAARAGDPGAYGRQALERAYRSLADRTEANPRDPVVKRNLTDLARAVLASPPAPTARAPTRAYTSAQPGHERSRQYHQQHRGRDLGIDR